MSGGSIRPLVVLWAAPGAAWSAEAIANTLGPLSADVIGVGAPDGIEGLGAVTAADADALQRIAAEYPERPLLLLRLGLRLPADFDRLVDEAGGLLPRYGAIAFPGDHDVRADPFAGLDTGALDRQLACHWCGDRRFLPLSDPPPDCLLLGPESAKGRARAPDVSEGWLLDVGYVRDPVAASAGDVEPEDLPHGHLRVRAQRLLESGDTELPAAGRGPVTLHVAHGWGGGVWRWIEDLAGADRDGTHLVLIAQSDDAGHRCGRFLQLCARGPGRGVIREAGLAPLIGTLADEHAGYRAQLEAIIERFGVGRIVVSSLIGHSLDCLRTGLPTLVMLHDFFPLWPLLDRDPLPFVEAAGGDAGQARRDALSAHPDSLQFSDAEPAFWDAAAGAWSRAVAADNVVVAAPTAHVIERVHALTGRTEPDIARLPHGFRPFENEPPTFEPPGDGPLHLLIPGRLTAGKGLALLRAVLPKLRGRVRLTAVGCGKAGLALMGQGGIDLVPQYRREELPALVASLRPHGALLLSTVPETWSYTLSEMRALGLAPIATRLGSFAERIDDGRDGVLFDPGPDALVEALAPWLDDPTGLAALAERAPAERTPSEVIGELADIVPPTAGREPGPIRTLAPDEVTADLLSARYAGVRVRLRAAEAECGRMRDELARRSRWAETMERQFRSRSAWAARLEEERRGQDARLAEQGEALARADRQYHDLSDRHRDLVERYGALERHFGELARQFESLQAEHADLQRLHRELGEREAALQARHDELQARYDDLMAQHRHLCDLHDELGRTHDALARRYATLERDHEHLAGQRDELQAEYDRLVASRSWRLTRPLRFSARVARNLVARRIFNPLTWPRLVGRFAHHWRLRGFRTALEMMQNEPLRTHAPEPVAPAEAPATADEAPPEPVTLPTDDAPEVSIVVPVYNQLAFTAACLESIAAHAGRRSFEVVVVDDASSDGTADWLPRCTGIRHARNENNLGFIGTCNRGAEMARGRYLVFLNNDTQVTDGWLDALVATFESYPDAGVVGVRLVYGDGRLQEAGGIVFADGSGWNYGRGDHPDRPEYGFVADVDYVSGACLAIERERFEALGGFDTHFAPAYYEDTDLCFRVREQGLRVLYQPACRVIHFEGVTSGTDESSGAKRFQAVNRDRFRERWTEALAGHPANPGAFSEAAARTFRDRRLPKRALVIDAVTPAPDQDSGSVRMFAMLKLLVDMGFRTSFLPENRAWTGRHSENLQQAGVEVLTAPWVTDPAEWFSAHGDQLDLVLVSRHYILTPLVRLVREYCPNARLVFDTVDLHFLREQREAELTGTPAAARAAEKTRREELALVEASDATLVVSEYERTLLADLVPEARVTVVSNIHSLHDPGRPFEQRRGLVFVGGFQHPPNLDAAEWLIDDILPRVLQRLPDVELHLIGSKMPESLKQRRAPGLRVHGFVADLEPFMTGCRVSVAPLRYGAGVKGKVNQAMSHGLPVVATRCAAEGMYAEDGREVLLADDAEAFADAVVRAYTDADLWRRLAENGRANVARHFSVGAARVAMEGLLADLDLPADAEQAATVSRRAAPN